MLTTGGALTVTLSYFPCLTLIWRFLMETQKVTQLSVMFLTHQSSLDLCEFDLWPGIHIFPWERSFMAAGKVSINCSRKMGEVWCVLTTRVSVKCLVVPCHYTIVVRAVFLFERLCKRPSIWYSYKKLHLQREGVARDILSQEGGRKNYK